MEAKKLYAAEEGAQLVGIETGSFRRLYKRMGIEPQKFEMTTRTQGRQIRFRFTPEQVFAIRDRHLNRSVPGRPKWNEQRALPSKVVEIHERRIVSRAAPEGFLVLCIHCAHPSADSSTGHRCCQ